MTKEPGTEAGGRRDETHERRNRGIEGRSDKGRDRVTRDTKERPVMRSAACHVTRSIASSHLRYAPVLATLR